MKKKVWLVTKNSYNGFRKRLGFIQRNTNGKYDDLYYDFTMVNGTHNSYHRDGSEWRTYSDGKKKKLGESIPLKNFKGLYPLGLNLFDYLSLYTLPNLKAKNIRNDILYEVDIEALPSSTYNIFIEMIDPSTVILNDENMKIPDNAVTLVIKDFEPWIIVTVLGYKENLIANFTNNGVTLNHFNERFTANGEGKQYELEQVPIGNKITFSQDDKGKIRIGISNK
ncbi:MAG: hypothetical protein COA66_10110 [Arcobacter sp.]|nr:MAG: hypothetical protein COA66_10110 [Arcobacter sp.]